MVGKRAVYQTMGLLVALLVHFMAIGIAQEGGTDAGGQWRYVLEGGGVTITGYETPPKGDVAIPEEWDGHPVTGIGEDALANGSQMTGVTLPGSVTKIGGWAFSRCYGLTGVTFPDSVTSVGDLAFYACMSLTAVTLPDSVKSIGTNPFAGCPLEEIGVSPDNPAYAQLDGVLFDKQRETLISYPGGRKGGYVIPYGVESIGDWAFAYCEALTNLLIPDSVTSMGINAFEGCKSLAWVTLPNSVTRIGEGTFSGCGSLIGVALPGSLTSIGDYAFYGCESLTRVMIPDSVESIGAWAFDGCENLISVMIPASVTFIGTEAFDGCDRLTLSVTKGSYAQQYANKYAIPYVLADSDAPIAVEDDGEERTDASGQWIYVLKDGGAKLWGYGKEPAGALTIPDRLDGYPVTAISDEALWSDRVTSVTIPASVKSIGDSAFLYCGGLTRIDVSPDNPAYAQLDGVLFDQSRQTLIAYPAARSGDYTVPAGTLHIGDNAFAQSAGLTEVILPDSVTSMGDYAFGNCKSLTRVTIGSGVTHIGSEAFYECAQLLSATLPDSVTDIGEYAFYKCSALTGVNIPERVGSIGEKAFWQCSSLADLVIPGSVGSIGYGAFAECGSLTGVTIGEGVPSLSDYAFYKCYGLTSLEIPDSVISIGTGAFYGCSGLTSLVIPGGVTEIADRLLAECSGLVSVTLPEGATRIGEYAFYYCNSLADVTIPANVASIGEDAFAGCETLTLHVTRNSAGEQYAKDNRMPYVFIGNADAGKAEADEAVLERGTQLMEAQDFDGALAHFDAAIAENVDVAEYHAIRADVLILLGRDAEAERAYAKAVQIEPDNARYWDEYGGILMFLSGRYQEAYEAIGRAVALEPSNGEYICDQGIALYYMGRDDEALAELERGMELSPDYPRAYDFASFLQCKRGAFGEAILLCEKGLAIMPDYDALLLTLGDAEFALGHYAEAVEAYDQAFSIGYFAAWDIENYGAAKRAIASGKAAEGFSDDLEEITVSTAQELLTALGSNRRIILEEGVYNLTIAAPGFDGNPNVSFQECYEGSELVLDGVCNLTLQGAGSGRSEIVIQPRDAAVIRFLNGTNIRIAGITAGHTEGGACEGGVFAFAYCAGISVEDTRMYGCGTLGLDLSWTADIEVMHSTISACTNGAMYIVGCSNVSFQDCVFTENAGDITVYVETASNVTIDSCSFLRNAGEYAMFSLLESENVVVKNTAFIGNNARELIYSDHNDTIFDASNRFMYNAFDGRDR